jgi:hypothetical protein
MPSTGLPSSRCVRRGKVFGACSVTSGNVVQIGGKGSKSSVRLPSRAVFSDAFIAIVDNRAPVATIDGVTHATGSATKASSGGAQNRWPTPRHTMPLVTSLGTDRCQRSVEALLRLGGRDDPSADRDTQCNTR